MVVLLTILGLLGEVGPSAEPPVVPTTAETGYAHTMPKGSWPGLPSGVSSTLPRVWFHGRMGQSEAGCGCMASEPERRSSA